MRSQLPAPGWLAAHVRAAGIALRQRRCFISNCRARRCFLKVGPAGAGAAQRRALPLYTPCMCSRLFPLHHHAMPQMPAHCPLPARPLPRAHPPTGAPRRCAPALPPAHLPALTTRGWAHSRGLASQLTSLRKLNVSLNGLDTLPKDLVRALPCPPGSQFTGQGFHLRTKPLT